MAASATVELITSGRSLNSRPSSTMGMMANVENSVGSRRVQKSESPPMAIHNFRRK